MLNPNSEVGEHTRPRVWLDPPRVQSLRAARFNNAQEKNARPEFSARARKTAPEGACAPRATSEFGLSRAFGSVLLPVTRLIPVPAVSREAALSDQQLAQCYGDTDWAAFENHCGKASD